MQFSFSLNLFESLTRRKTFRLIDIIHFVVIIVASRNIIKFLIVVISFLSIFIRRIFRDFFIFIFIFIITLLFYFLFIIFVFKFFYIFFKFSRFAIFSYKILLRSFFIYFRVFASKTKNNKRFVKSSMTRFIRNVFEILINIIFKRKISFFVIVLTFFFFIILDSTFFTLYRFIYFRQIYFFNIFENDDLYNF